MMQQLLDALGYHTLFDVGIAFDDKFYWWYYPIVATHAWPPCSVDTDRARTYAIGGQLRQDICHGWAATPGHMPWVGSYARTYAMGGQLRQDICHGWAATPGHMPWVGSYDRTYAVGGQLRQDICHGWAATPGHMPWVGSYAMASYAMGSCAGPCHILRNHLLLYNIIISGYTPSGQDRSSFVTSQRTG